MKKFSNGIFEVIFPDTYETEPPMIEGDLKFPMTASVIGIIPIRRKTNQMYEVCISPRGKLSHAGGVMAIIDAASRVSLWNNMNKKETHSVKSGIIQVGSQDVAFFSHKSVNAKTNYLRESFDFYGCPGVKLQNNSNIFDVKAPLWIGLSAISIKSKPIDEAEAIDIFRSIRILGVHKKLLKNDMPP